ncbi:hypothetical protein PSYMO_36603, partial [Pseudomonas amygdali pv. mori str. 301020]
KLGSLFQSFPKQKTQKLRELIEDLKKSDHVVEKLRAEIEPLM